MLGSVLCGWHIYLGVLCLLLALSAGTRTGLGRLALAALAASVAQVVWLYRPEWAFGHLEGLKLGGSVYVAAVALLGLAAGRRQDTRLIALLALGAGLLPIFLFFYHTGG